MPNGSDQNAIFICHGSCKTEVNSKTTINRWTLIISATKAVIIDFDNQRNKEREYKLNGYMIQLSMHAETSNVGILEIPIGDKSISFTATHLEEVQQILYNEGWREQAPKRQPKKEKSVLDEDEEEI